MFRRLPALLPGILLLASCANNKEVKLEKGVGINTAYMDTTVNPADDFFTFVNGNWVSQTQIPSDQGRWGSFNELGENTRNAVLSVLKDAGSGNLYKDGSDQRKAADFFVIGMDSTQAENMRLKPIEPYLEKINAIASKKDLQQYLAEQQRVDGGAFFGLGVNTDLKKSNEVALYLNAGDLDFRNATTIPRQMINRRKRVRNM